MNGLSLPKSKIDVLLLEGIHNSAKRAFEQAGYTNVEVLSGALTGQALVDRLQNVHILGIRSRTELTSAVLRQCPKLITVGCFCIGTNQVDIAAAEAFGIPVFNAPFSNTRSVAELVLAEMILLLRRIPEKNSLLHQGTWQKSADASFEARGKILGIIGYGHIGSQLSVLAEALGMKVIFHDIEHKLPLGNASTSNSLTDLLQQSDVVSLHVPDTAQTRNMISTVQLKQMRPAAILINASRGQVVDIDALAASLKQGYLAGAAIDVFPIEPSSNQERFFSPLQQLPNVILTPHVGGSTVEAQINIGSEVAEKLIKYSDNGSTLSAVNFPQVSLPPHPGQHRFLHIHHNQPGVLRAINAIFSEASVNITGQYLQTTPNIGYVVMDIEQEHGLALLPKLRQVPGTLRARVLF